MGKGKKEELSLEELLEQALVKEEEQPLKVNENWVWTSLDNITFVTKLAGFEYTKNIAPNLTDTGIPLFKGKNIKNGELSYEFESFIPKNISDELPRSKVNNKCLLTPYVGAIGNVAIFEGNRECHLGSNVGKIEILKKKVQIMIEEYLLYYLRSDIGYRELTKEKKATAQESISIQAIRNVYVPIPPLAEQQRIVERIESLFQKLDKAKELAQNALDSFENRKVAILHKAFTGELTAKWREENGVSLESWEEKPFKEFCLLKRGYDLPAQSRISGEYPLVSSSGIIDTHNEMKVQGPGIVTGRSGTIGKVHYIENDFWPLNTTLYSQKLFGNVPKYIYYYLMTFDFKTYSSSTAVPTLNRNLFLDVPIKVPNIREQEVIVYILDKLLANEQQAQEICNVIEKIDLMKKAILARAFRGELGTNNPEEESAIELLKEVLKEKL